MKNRARLTTYQRQLLSELEEIASLTRLNYPDITKYDPDERTGRLQFMKNQLIRSQVIMDYAFVDEMLGADICHYFFGKKAKFHRLWKTKKFRTFNYYILEVLSLTEKLRLVKAITNVPKSVAGNIEHLNALRNGLAHAFFPENLRSYKPIYKGKSIFSVEGLAVFIDDMRHVSDYFLHRNFGIKTQEEGDVAETPKTTTATISRKPVIEDHAGPPSDAADSLRH